LRPEQKRLLKIQLAPDGDDIEIDGLVLLDFGDYQQRVRVRAVIGGLNPDFEVEILNFGVCDLGRLNRVTLRILNNKSQDSTIAVVVKPPFFTTANSITVQSNCFVYLSIHFVPLEEGPFQGVIQFEPDNSRTFAVPVLGSGRAALWGWAAGS
jgi:hypothetical protein